MIKWAESEDQVCARNENTFLDGTPFRQDQVFTWAVGTAVCVVGTSSLESTDMAIANSIAKCMSEVVQVLWSKFKHDSIDTRMPYVPITKWRIVPSCHSTLAPDIEFWALQLHEASWGSSSPSGGTFRHIMRWSFGALEKHGDTPESKAKQTGQPASLWRLCTQQEQLLHHLEVKEAVSCLYILLYRICIFWEREREIYIYIYTVYIYIYQIISDLSLSIQK